MARTTRHDNESSRSIKQGYDRSEARKQLKDFERQYIAVNKDPQIYL